MIYSLVILVLYLVFIYNYITRVTFIHNRAIQLSVHTAL